MRRGELIAGVAIAATALGSWSLSLAYDAGEVSEDSYVAGQQWARQHDPTIEQCEHHALQLPGRGMNSVSWEQGCRDVIGASR